MKTITKPYLPNQKEYKKLIDDIWNRNILTNNGPLVNQLENELIEYLKLDNLILTSNGTIALQIALKALSIKNKVLTTPFSYIATTSSILWENCDPIFVDIDPANYNIDPNKIEAQITPETSAILATHVFGCPCDVESLEEISKKHNLKLIYDAAHAFGVEYNGNSVLNYGDLSTTSFHATKLFHTIEGGAITTLSQNLSHICKRMRNFGHKDLVSFECIGVNGKMSEFHAAMGICVLKDIDKVLTVRKQQYELYKSQLGHIKSLSFQSIDNEKVKYNYSYFPILFNNTQSLIDATKRLEANNIFARRYFYPSLNKIDYLDTLQSCPIAESVASRVLCLPMYHELKDHEIKEICQLIEIGL
ncbi:MAG: DegT/DnrJ/EryC1/StrS family aminotransferase [bacterium]|nr:DegT/DnrJ/EryC1/StrS family aminotransferase [bacterium]